MKRKEKLQKRVDEELNYYNPLIEDLNTINNLIYSNEIEKAEKLFKHLGLK